MPENNLISKKILMVMGPFSGKAWGAGQQDSYNLIKLLKELGHDIYLVSYDYMTNYEFVNKFKEAGAQVFVIPLNAGISIWRTSRILKNLALLADPATHPFFKLCLNEDFKKLLEKIHPEIVIGIQTFTFPVLDFVREKSVVAVLRSQNLEYNHRMDMLRSWQFLNPLNYIFYISKFFSERHSAMSSSLVLAISPLELTIYSKWNPNSKLLPLCSLYEKIKNPRERLNENRDAINIFYAGASYNILPHLRGAEFLIEKIVPRLKIMGFNNFKLHIIGSKLPQRLIDKCDGEKIIYRGYVDDYEAVLNEMDAGVFPVFTGRGMKQKIFEAISRGFPVIAPKKSLGGYSLTHEKNILLADKCDEFAENIIKLENKEKRKKISYAAYEFAKDNFNKDYYIKTLREFLT